LSRGKNLFRLVRWTIFYFVTRKVYSDETYLSLGLLEPQTRTNVDYFIVIDFEATCEEKNPLGYPHEIIEFPAVLVSSGYDKESKSPEIAGVFHAFVRPVINPVLSEFCKNLTGIEQAILTIGQS